MKAKGKTEGAWVIFMQSFQSQHSEGSVAHFIYMLVVSKTLLCSVANIVFLNRICSYMVRFSRAIFRLHLIKNSVFDHSKVAGPFIAC